MSREHDIVHVLRGVAVWLLALCVFLGPTGGGSAALATTGEVSCPCDDAKSDHIGDHDDPCDEGAGGEAHEAGDPCEDECPDGCPDCGCCPGIAMAVLPQPLRSGTASRMPARMLAPIQTPASGTGSCVFRPPRSRT